MRADAKANRDELLTTAAKLISEKGVDVSLRSVLAAAGVGIGTRRDLPGQDEWLLGVYLRG